MKVLHCSDLHAHRGKFEWLVRIADQYDLVCITGDFLDLTDGEHLEDQIQMVLGALKRISKQVAVCSGNNDSVPENTRMFQAAWIKEISCPKIWGDGGRHAFHGFQVRCVAWNALLSESGADEIWLVHAPPAAAGTAVNRVDRSDCGDIVLAERCRSGRGPFIALSGHQHEPSQWACRVNSSWSFNPGSDPRSGIPNYIVLDLDLSVAELHIGDRPHDSVKFGR